MAKELSNEERAYVNQKLEVLICELVYQGHQNHKEFEKRMGNYNQEKADNTLKEIEEIRARYRHDAEITQKIDKVISNFTGAEKKKSLGHTIKDFISPEKEKVEK